MSDNDNRPVPMAVGQTQNEDLERFDTLLAELRAIQDYLDDPGAVVPVYEFGRRKSAHG